MATRIKDGIFVADGESSQDGEFVEMNKISYVINCAGSTAPEHVGAARYPVPYFLLGGRAVVPIVRRARHG